LIHFDHLVIAARELQEGVQWVESRLGVPMGAGGSHHAMGTHNRLLSLGPGRFLEVIAVDPQGRPPGRPRWFELDSPAMQARLARGPALIHWVARADDIDAAIAAMPGEPPEVLALSRGAFRWKIGVPPDGSLRQAGVAPTIIQWFTEHPTEVLQDSGCRLESLVLRHPGASAMLHALRFAGLAADEPVQAHHEGTGLEARIRARKGVVVLRE
jgi:hypothetical protein